MHRNLVIGGCQAGQATVQ